MEDMGAGDQSLAPPFYASPQAAHSTVKEEFLNPARAAAPTQVRGPDDIFPDYQLKPDPIHQEPPTFAALSPTQH